MASKRFNKKRAFAGNIKPWLFSKMINMAKNGASFSLIRRAMDKNYRRFKVTDSTIQSAISHAMGKKLIKK